MVVMGGAAAPANYQGPARIEPGEREVVAFIVRPVSGCTWPARPPVRNDRCRPEAVNGDEASVRLSNHPTSPRFRLNRISSHMSRADSAQDYATLRS